MESIWFFVSYQTIDTSDTVEINENLMGKYNIL